MAISSSSSSGSSSSSSEKTGLGIVGVTQVEKSGSVDQINSDQLRSRDSPHYLMHCSWRREYVYARRATQTSNVALPFPICFRLVSWSDQTPSRSKVNPNYYGYLTLRSETLSFHRLKLAGKTLTHPGHRASFELFRCRTRMQFSLCWVSLFCFLRTEGRILSHRTIWARIKIWLFRSYLLTFYSDITYKSLSQRFAVPRHC